MNEVHLQQIFTNYVNRFEEFNSDDPKQPSEYYKWEMPKPFKDAMNQVLKTEGEDTFKQQLDEIGRITNDFIDSKKTLPFAGLIKLVNEFGEWKAVQRLFQGLYEEDYGDLEVRQKKIERFLDQAYQLKEKHNLSDLYKSDFRSATVYLFLYDPDHNYIYKPEDAHSFQDCIEFYDNFGEGYHVRLKTYYRMCDQVVEAIRNDSAIRATKELREPKFKNKENVWEDKEWHILAYDIIYCCSSYDLLRGITFERLTSTERKLRWERQQKARELLNNLEVAQEKKKTLDATTKKIEEWFSVGRKVTYKSFGKGTPVKTGVITRNANEVLTIDFGDGDVMKIGVWNAISNGYVHAEEVDSEELAQVVQVLKNKSGIEIELANAEKDFAPYHQYV